MPNGEPGFKKRSQEKFITHMSWRKYRTCGKGPHREVEAECRQRKMQDLGHISLKFPDWSIQTEKSRVLVAQGGCLSKAHKGKAMGGEETVRHKGFLGVLSRIYICLGLPCHALA